MPDIGADLITYLKTIPEITAIVGSGVSARIYQNIVKQGVQSPFIMIVVYGGTSAEDLGGVSGLAENRVEVNCYANTSADCYALGEAIRLAPLQGYRGPMGSATVTGVTSEFGAERGFDPPTSGGNVKRYWEQRDFNISYYEATEK